MPDSGPLADPADSQKRAFARPDRPLHPWDEKPEGPPPPPITHRPAHIFGQTRDWSGYFAATAGRPPRETLLEALHRFDAEASADASRARLAIDLGCGEGRDTAELLRRGWRVLAIDGHPEAFQRLVIHEGIGPTPRLTMRMVLLEEVELPPCDLLNASFALPFCRPDSFGHLWGRILDSIRTGGRLAGQLFGDRDSWAALPDRSHHTRAEAESLLEPFEIERFDEEEREGKDCAETPKHWHVFHVVARRR